MSFDTVASSPVGVRMLDDLVIDGFATTRALADLTEAKLYEYVTRAAVEISSEKWSSVPGRVWPWEERVSTVDAEQLAREVVGCGAARWWSAGQTSSDGLSPAIAQQCAFHKKRAIASLRSIPQA